MILVTGASGRIGQVVTAGLRHAGLAVRATDIRPGESVDVLADLCDQAAAGSLVENVDCIVHLAGHPNSRDWTVLDRQNVGATRTLLNAAGVAGVRRFVYASSVHASGLLPANAYLSADLPIAADSPYGVSKVVGEALLHYHCHQYRMSGAALRICAFRPAPSNARELRLWISPSDMVRLAIATVTADFDGVRTIWGLSANRRANVSREEWDAIGYRPLDEAEDHQDRLALSGVDIELVSEWPLLGGAFAVPQV